MENENLRHKGSLAEDRAIEYLEQHGYIIEKRNFHFGKYGEIDIIARHEGILVFIEVKARWSMKFGEPEYAVTPSKIKALRRVAEGYLYIRTMTDIPCRFDIIALDYSGEHPVLRHLENAF